MNKKNKVSIFLDSGAFSAFTQGVEIDIQKYIEFIKENENHLEIYANLDVIGDASATWKNQKKMERAGLLPMPCFHFGEDWKWLERYVKNYEYIALGGVAKKSDYANLTKWLDECFKRICNKNGIPKTKVHGFGITRLRLLHRYPWYSVDSTSWVISSRMGMVYVPRTKSGKWDYSKEPFKVSVSNRSPTKKERGKHIDNMSIQMKSNILDYFQSKGYDLGKSDFRMEDEKYDLKENEKWSGKAVDGKRNVETIIEAGLSNNYRKRDELNVIYFLDLEKSFPTYPKKYKKTASGLGVK